MKIAKEKLKEKRLESIQKVYIIKEHDELVAFLMEILKIKDNVNSEEELQTKNAYRILYSLLEKISVFTVVVEEKYVERVYRDSYYMYFSGKHAQYDRFCKRLFLFQDNIFEENGTVGYDFPDMNSELLQEKFVGTVVIRPLQEGKIGRSLINPYFVTDTENTYLRYAEYSASLFGKRLRINAFPYSMQDGETTTCAEITILNLLDYYSQRYSEYKYILPSEIADIVVKNGYERTLPSKGLGYAIITKVFSEAGFYPRLYGNDMFQEMSKFKRIMHYYIESGIPVALGVKSIINNTAHSIVCIGHGKIREDIIGKKKHAVYDDEFKEHIWIIDSADLCTEYIIMDDGQSPYSNYQWEVQEQEIFSPIKYTLGKYEPVTLMVPLYKRMFLEAEDAYDVCTTALCSNVIGIRRFCPQLGLKDNPAIIRLFMASSRNFKHRRISGFGKTNEEVRARYIETLFPRFVWVCEIYSKESYCEKKVIGEIVVDATASPYDNDKILIAHYPYFIMARKIEEMDKTDIESDDFKGIPREEIELENLFERVHAWESFDGYTHNLSRPERNK